MSSDGPTLGDRTSRRVNGEPTATLDLGPDATDLLEEAMFLLDSESRSAVVERALRELVERHRFLLWVSRRERTERTGSA